MSDVIIVDGSGIVKKDLAATQDPALTLYVRSTGSDTNDGRTVGTALATIQAAVDKLPYYIEDVITIDIGEGDFGTFVMENKEIAYQGAVNFEGTLGAFTPATGPSSGTAIAGGDTHHMHIAGTPDWTPGDLIGKLVRIAGGDYWVIQDNTATTLTIVGSNGVAMGEGVTYSLHTPLTVSSGSGLVRTGGFYFATPRVRLRNMNLGYFVIVDCTSVSLQNTVATFWAQNCGVEVKATYATGHTSGAYFSGCASVSIDGLLARANTSGVILQDVSSILGMYAAANSNTQNGFVFTNSFGYVASLEASSNGQNGVHLDVGSKLGRADRYDNAVHTLLGTGNTQYGMWVDSGCELVFSASPTAPTLTGTSGDLTLDRGATPLSWATHFAANGDAAVNPNLLCRAERRD